MKIKNQIITLLVSGVLAFGLMIGRGFSQNPQTTTAPLQPANSKYTQGTGPGYWPTPGAGLVLNLAAGTGLCTSTPVTYSGGTLSLTDNAANNIYLNPAAACAPAAKTTAFAAGDVPIAIVTTASGVITTILDLRQSSEPIIGTGTIGGSIATGQTAYGSAANTIAGTSVTINMLASVGADLGAKMNACATALPAAGGICNGDDLPASTLSTAVTTAKPVIYTFCGQAISQSGAVTLGGANSGIIGCPGAATTFTKAASIDQFTVTGTRATIQNITLAGVKASFTGNGILLNGSSSAAIYIAGNVINGEANDDLKDQSAFASNNVVEHNTFGTWGTHAFETTSALPVTIFTHNRVVGDGTSTGVAILNPGIALILQNFIQDSNGTILVDTSGSSSYNAVIGNTLRQTNGWPGVKGGTPSLIAQNLVQSGGANGAAITGQGTIVGNFVNVTNQDGIDIVNGTSVVENNNVNMSMSGVSGKCAINLSGDLINTRVAHNQISVGDNAADTNYGECDTPTSTHNLNILFDGDVISTTLSVGATVYAFFLNNAANVNTNWIVTIENIGAIHVAGLLKRTDTQNNKTTYKNIQIGDGALDAGTGSTADVFSFDNLSFTFATIPTPIGNGSHFYCSDCTQAKPTANGGPGAFVVREGGANNGL